MDKNRGSTDFRVSCMLYYVVLDLGLFCYTVWCLVIMIKLYVFLFLVRQTKVNWTVKNLPKLFEQKVNWTIIKLSKCLTKQICLAVGSPFFSASQDFAYVHIRDGLWVWEGFSFLPGFLHISDLSTSCKRNVICIVLVKDHLLPYKSNKLLPQRWLCLLLWTVLEFHLVKVNVKEYCCN